MFCIDLLGFSIDPPYFGYNSAEQETLILCILTFQEPSGTQIDRGFLWREYFYIRSNLGCRSAGVSH
jgi:hypothetical protein